MDQIKTKHPEHRYKKGLDRSQGFLLPPSLEEMVEADSPVRVVDALSIVWMLQNWDSPTPAVDQRAMQEDPPGSLPTC